MSTRDENPRDNNPYVGPESFSKTDKDYFFGRDTEARDLLSLVLSSQVVLFYAQSGAGKTSLIHTRLEPNLEEEGFEVLPLGRVSGEAAPGVEVENIFVYNLLLSLDQSEEHHERFANMELKEFLINLIERDGKFVYEDQPDAPEEDDSGPAEDDHIWPRALIIDQFEELLTTHPEAWQQREGFFNQLRQAMAYDEYLWVVFAMREDYVAALRPYAHLMPGGLRTRYYMQRMETKAALDAVKRPAGDKELGNRPFEAGVAEKLVEELASIRTKQPDDSIESVPGQFVEPVQLQVVCYQLWESLKGEARSKIEWKDLNRLAGGRNWSNFVDKALAQFYEDAIAEVARETDQTEFVLREWFGTQLITDAKTRNLVRQAKDKVNGLDKEVVRALQSRFLLQSEGRAGSRWYELVHDRFIDPILQSNQQWERKHPLIRDALDWDKEKSESKLYQGPRLAAAYKHRDAKIELVGAFLDAGRAAEKKREEEIRAEEEQKRKALLAEEEKKRAEERAELSDLLAEEQTKRADEEKKRADEAAKNTKRLRWLAVALVVMCLVAIVFAIIAYRTFKELQSQNWAKTAQQMVADDPDLALVLALEAHENIKSFFLEPSPQIDYALAAAAYGSGTRQNFLPDAPAPVYSLAISPDGRSILTGDANGKLTLWDVETGEERKFEGHTDVVWSVAFSPDGTKALSGSADHSLILWNVETGQELQRFGGADSNEGHQDWVFGVAFSPDGTKALSGSADHSLILWDVETGQELRRFGGDGSTEGHTDRVYSVAFSPDGNYALSGSEDKTVILWDLNEGKVIHTLEGHKDWVRTVAFNPKDENLAISGSTNELILWDLQSGKNLERFNDELLADIGGTVYSLAFSPDGRTALSGSQDIILWNVENGTKLRRFRGHLYRVRAVAFGPGESNTIFSGSVDNSMRRWDLDIAGAVNRFVTGAADPGGEVWSVAISPDQQYVLAGYGTNENNLKLWDLKSGQQVDRLFEDHSEGVSSVAFSPDSHTALTGSADGRVIFWDVEKGEPIPGFEKQETEHGAVWSVAISPDGQTALSGHADGTVILWDLENEKKPHQLKGHAGQVYRVAISPDGQTALSGSEDIEGNPNLILWNLETKEKIGQLDGQRGSVWSLAFSPDGGTALSGTVDGSLILWDIPTSTEIRRFTGHAAEVWSVAFSPDGRTAVSGSLDHSLILWDVATGKAIYRFEEQAGPVYAVTFAPDGKSILSGSADGNLYLWQLLPAADELVEWIPDHRNRRELTSVEKNQFGIDNEFGINEWFTSLTALFPASSSTSTPTPTPTPSPAPSPRLATMGTFPGEIPVGGKQVWVYEGEQGEALTIRVEADRPANQVIPEERRERGLLDTSVVVKKPDGTVWRQHDDIDNRKITNSVIEGQLTVSGRYSIEVGTWDSLTGGSYQLKIEQQSEIELNFPRKRGIKAGESTSWIFEQGQKGQVIRVAMKADSDDLDPFLTVLGPDGTVLAMDDDSGGAKNSLISGILLPEDGAYTIIAEGYENSSGEYTLSLTKLNPQYISFEIPVPGDTDDATVLIFKGEAGQIVRITMDADVGSELDPYVTLMDQNGTVIAQDDDRGADRNALLRNIVLPQNGAYNIIPSGIGATGRYSLLLTQVKPESINPGQTVTNSMEITSAWTFDGQVGQIFNIEMKENNSGLDTILTLVGPDGEIIAENDDIQDSTNSFIGNVVLPRNGTYIILADGYDTTGAYTLTLTEVNPKTITPDAPETITLEDSSAVWTFDGQAGQTVSLALAAEEGNLSNAFLTLRGPTGEFIADNSVENAAISNVELPGSGKYILILEANNGSGRYTLTLSEMR
jgi:WD40 repeat protein